MKHFTYSVLLIGLLFSCSQHIDKGDIESIEIDQSDEIDFSDLFSEYKLIFPEAKDSAFFGLQI
ncbi:MAG: hypothetical protein LBR10_15560, partial [Prevotellaceae bacterium]|nr:hypothetical protein [Prevotellaceae bacterium]